MRNRIKRWCREYFKSQTLHPSKNYDVNVIIRASSDANYFKKLKYDVFKDEMDKAISQFFRKAK